MSNNTKQFSKSWFLENLKLFPSLKLDSRFFPDGDLGDLTEIEFENDTWVGAINLWGSGQLGLMLVAKEGSETRLNILIPKDQKGERETACKKLFDLLSSKPKIEASSSKIQLLQGDITRVKADAIVNAANTSLLGGGGVDGAIHRAGGSEILEECRAIRNRQGGCKVGQAVITTAGKLSAKYVIHTVGPVWNQGKSNEEKLLASAYYESLLLASQNNIQVLAFPNISTGIYRFPKEKAAKIAVDTVAKYLSEHSQIKKVIFVCYDAENYGIYAKLL